MISQIEDSSFSAVALRMGLANAKRLVVALLPPVLPAVLRRLTNRQAPENIRFTGNYSSWEAAEADSTGYQAEVILERTCAALLKVKRGEAVYERDSVLFDEVFMPFPLLAGLLRAAVEDKNRLSVLDFGGSLGSTYFQCRRFLEPVIQLEWSIVEQRGHVERGRLRFQDHQLKFYETIEECHRFQAPNVLLLSGVVGYVPRPYEFLDTILKQDYAYIIVDRTGFLGSNEERLTVQHVPASIYPATYPAWFLSEDRFLQHFAERYDLVTSFDALDTPALSGARAYSKGFIFRSKRIHRPDCSL